MTAPVFTAQVTGHQLVADLRAAARRDLMAIAGSPMHTRATGLLAMLDDYEKLLPVFKAACDFIYVDGESKIPQWRALYEALRVITGVEHPMAKIAGAERITEPKP